MIVFNMSNRDSILKTIDFIINISIAVALVINILLIQFGVFIAGLIFSLVALILYKLNKIRIPPPYFPIISEDWVVWEYTICINTKGLKLSIEELYDSLATKVKHQDIPLDVFYVRDACWIIKKAQFIKIHTDFRSRIITQLEDSPYKNIHFIAGLDYLGTCWVNMHLMIINYPQHIKNIPKPLRRDRYLARVNTIAIKSAGIILVLIINLCQTSNLIPASVLVSLLLTCCWIVIRINYDFKILPPHKMYSRAEIIKYEHELERINKIESIYAENLPRHFKWDDLRLFHEIMRRLVIDIIVNHLKQQESIFTEGKEFNLFKSIIPPSEKDLFDNV